MSRVKIKFPEQKPLYTAVIPVRIGDINYGGHVGNDATLSIIHEARMQMLSNAGYSEMNAAGNSMIMADVMIAYKGEAFYGDILHVHIYAEEIGARSFDLLYDCAALRGDELKPVAHCKTGMVCFNYETRKTEDITEEFRVFLAGH